MARTLYWVGDGTYTSFTNSVNWSLSSGGAGGEGYPTALDIFHFDGNGTGDCDVDVAIDVTGGNFAVGYTGTITGNSNNFGFGAGGLDASAASGMTWDVSGSDLISYGDVTIHESATITSGFDSIELAGTADVNLATPMTTNLINSKTAGKITNDGSGTYTVTSMPFGTYSAGDGTNPPTYTATGYAIDWQSLGTSTSSIDFAAVNSEWDEFDIDGGSVDYGTSNFAARSHTIASGVTVTKGTANIVGYGTGELSNNTAAAFDFYRIDIATGADLQCNGSTVALGFGNMHNGGKITHGATAGDPYMRIYLAGGTYRGYDGGERATNNAGSIAYTVGVVGEFIGNDTLSGDVCLVPYLNGTTQAQGDWRLGCIGQHLAPSLTYGSVVFTGDTDIGDIECYAPDTRTTAVDNSGGHLVRCYGDIEATIVGTGVANLSGVLTPSGTDAQTVDVQAATAYPSQLVVDKDGGDLNLDWYQGNLEGDCGAGIVYLDGSGDVTLTDNLFDGGLDHEIAVGTYTGVFDKNGFDVNPIGDSRYGGGGVSMSMSMGL